MALLLCIRSCSQEQHPFSNRPGSLFAGALPLGRVSPKNAASGYRSSSLFYCQREGEVALRLSKITFPAWVAMIINRSMVCSTQWPFAAKSDTFCAPVQRDFGYFRELGKVTFLLQLLLCVSGVYVCKSHAKQIIFLGPDIVPEHWFFGGEPNSICLYCFYRRSADPPTLLVKE